MSEWSTRLTNEDEIMAMPARATDERQPSSRDCPICGGDGFLIGDDDAEVQCDTCDGSGHIPRDSQAA